MTVSAIGDVGRVRGYRSFDEELRLLDQIDEDPRALGSHLPAYRTLINNGTASGDSGLKNARLPPLDVRTSKRVLAAIRILPALKATEQRGLRCCVTLPETTAH